ncbi:MAG: EMC3/TMCO1 family protein [Nitrosotalea sp.]
MYKIKTTKMEAIILGFLNSIYLQIPGMGQSQLGSANPWVKGLIPSAFGIIGIAIMLNLFNAAIRKKMVDQDKLKRLMKETRSWQKDRMAAFRAKDQEKIDQINKKSAYMNKLNMEIMQLNMRPMAFTFIPFLLIFYFLLPHMFSYTVVESPIPLNVFPGNFFHLTCSIADVQNEAKSHCAHANDMYFWGWYFLSSISMSGIIMRVTKTTSNLD